MTRRGSRSLVCSLAAVLLLVGPAGARAQDYPTKPIEIVVPFVPGGGTDLIARLTADWIGKKWGQPVLVVNKPGGGGIIGARAALKEARPDGYTVLMDIHTISSMHIGAWKTPQLTLADRKYAGRIVRDPMVFAVKADAPWKTLKEFSEWVKANPTELVWSTVGPSGPSRYTAYDWFTQIGVDPAKTKMVITEGAADSFTKLAGGHIVLSIHSVAEAFAMTKAGKIKLLAVLSPSRVRYLPDVPTAEEQGVIKGTRIQWWAAAAFPAATPDPIVRKWEAALAEMAKDPQFLAGAERLNMNIDYLGAAETRAFVEKEVEGYTEMATKIGIRR
ncbi:MAG TPA: tripartite tricarboxylate transporter substrate binding protein [Methylomirabilota bacterium]|jgi:tripartite-type tricarboxylate transporter receptor subunit TctC|nr:tripartite tricarboxylate transporter substrate binding protein [Methylomirabilota bacterium]